MAGWKGYAGALIIAIGGALDYLFPDQRYSELLYAVGAALGIVGIRAKQERTEPGK